MCFSGYWSKGYVKKNIDVAGGLVNGAFGTVVHISESQNNDDDFPSAIHVEFDNANVGKIQRSKTRQRFSENSTVIEVQEDQFPLRLAWACTVHKVQGLTVDKAVVSLTKIFTAGQAYVALSRVRSLSGLIIEDFKESAIFCNKKIEDSFTESLGRLKIALLNVQSLKAHFQDVLAHKVLMNADCICLTETWLNADEKAQELQIPEFVFKHNPRAKCYDNSTALFTELKHQRGGGVGMYCSDKIKCNIITPEHWNLECLYFIVPHVNLTAALLYRPTTYKSDMFRQQLLHVIEEIEKHPGQKIIISEINGTTWIQSKCSKSNHRKGNINRSCLYERYGRHKCQCCTNLL
ncbi:ATP-dependent DNA helicase PIF1 [Labeo rohita]|uniref:ATP-dependent DNA helicase PIF1 n=1 Tax=Labeo rohita TaxID=84645 RepID=A0ABQ8L878_LABRO|nr:ATP-dependent DNA helicase PIF1 [Labeo rohita]